MKEVNHILMPTDFSQEAQQALRYAVGLAHQLNADLHLLHVITGAAGSAGTSSDAEEKKLRTEMRAEASRYRRALSRSSRRGDWTMSCTVRRHTEAAQDIMEYAAGRHVDLIVISSSGQRRGDRLIMGSTTEKVMRLASCDVLTTGLRGKHRPEVMGPILVPIDFSSQSAHALKRAGMLAKQAQVRLELLHVVETSIVPGERPGSVTVSARKTHKEALAELEQFYHCTKEVDVPRRFHVRRGRPTKEIASFAERENIHFIVQGSRGRSGIDYALHGSVAETVVRQSPCPVLTVKTPPPALSPDFEQTTGEEKHHDRLRSLALLAGNPKIEVVP